METAPTPKRGRREGGLGNEQLLQSISELNVPQQNGLDWESARLYTVLDDGRGDTAFVAQTSGSKRKRLGSQSICEDFNGTKSRKKSKRPFSSIDQDAEPHLATLQSPQMRRKRRKGTTSVSQEPVEPLNLPETSEVASGQQDIASSSNITDSEELRQILSLSNPVVPDVDDRWLNLTVSNPYAADEVSEHPRLTSICDPVTIQNEVWVDGMICANGLVKFRLQFDNPKVGQHAKDILEKHRSTRNKTQYETKMAGDVSYLPPGFGRGLHLDEMDMRLFKFCKYP